MEDWPVGLVSDVEVDPGHPGVALHSMSRSSPLGLFMRDHQGGVQISYAPRLLKKPMNLIATFSHELAHYVVHSIEDTLPCDPSEEEHLTDETACFLGFGVFMANCRFDFRQFGSGTGYHGWSTQRSGYLPEIDLIFDTALFIIARKLDPKPAYDYLKPHLADYLKKALVDADAYREDLEAAISGAFRY